MAKMTAPDDGRPRVWVQVQVVMPPEYGGDIITEIADLPIDHYIPGQGKGVEAMIEWAARSAKQSLRAAGHPETPD